MADGIDAKLESMRKEFNAADEFAKQARRHQQTPVVDDDYPQVRFEYERALLALIEAMKANGRFQQGTTFELVLRGRG